MLNRNSLLSAVILVLVGCSPQYYTVKSDAPRAAVRVVSELTGNTMFQLADVDACKKPKPSTNTLGWFHPGGGQSVQAARRGFDRRIGMKGGEIYPPHMYAEHFINSDQPLGLYIDNVSGVVFGSISLLDFCSGFYTADILPEHFYEFVARENEESCEVIGYELIESQSIIARVPIKIERACHKKR